MLLEGIYPSPIRLSKRSGKITMKIERRIEGLLSGLVVEQPADFKFLRDLERYTGNYRNILFFFLDSHDEIILNSQGGIGLFSLHKPSRFFRAICSISPNPMSVESFHIHQARPALSNSRLKLRPFGKNTSPIACFPDLCFLIKTVTTLFKTRSEVKAFACFPKA